MYGLFALAAFLPGRAQFSVSTGTPVHTVQSFVGSLNRGDLKSACGLVVGGRFSYPAQLLQGILHQVAQKQHSNPKLLDVSSIGEAKIESQGQAEVPVTVAIVGQEPVVNTVHLQNKGGRWLIVPSMTPSGASAPIVNAFSMGAAQPVAMLAIVIPVIYQAAGKQPDEGKDLGSGASLLLMCAALNKDVWPKDFADLKRGLEPVSKRANLASVVETTVKKASENHWTINKALAGKKQTEMKDPFQTVLLYEKGPKGIDYRFQGKAIIALAVGVTRLVTPAQAAKLRWTP